MGHNLATRLRTALGIIAALGLIAHTAIGVYTSRISLFPDNLFSWHPFQSSFPEAKNCWGKDCLARLQDIEWRNTTAAQRGSETASSYELFAQSATVRARFFGVNEILKETVVKSDQKGGNASDLASSSREWDWRGDERQCGFVKWRGETLQSFLKDVWIVVAGDSQTRLLLVSLLQMMLPSAPPPQFNRHSDVHNHVSESNTTVDFLWNPYPSNITASVKALTTNGSCPHVVVLGAGLWHILWIGDSLEYERSLIELRNAILELRNCRTTRTNSLNRHLYRKENLAPMFVWLGLPTLIPARLNTDRKRRVMTRDEASNYHAASHKSGLVGVNGPCLEIEMEKLSRGCGDTCTEDGMHYNDATFEACVMVLLNMENLLQCSLGMLHSWYVQGETCAESFSPFLLFSPSFSFGHRRKK